MDITMINMEEYAERILNEPTWENKDDYFEWAFYKISRIKWRFLPILMLVTISFTILPGGFWGVLGLLFITVFITAKLDKQRNSNKQ